RCTCSTDSAAAARRAATSVRASPGFIAGPGGTRRAAVLVAASQLMSSSAACSSVSSGSGGDAVFGAEVIVPSHHVLWVLVQKIDHPWTEDAEFVRLYDVENVGMWDFDYYSELAVQLGAQHVADTGCGTGVLALELARRGIEVTGVDPAAAMIEVARSRVADAQLGESVQL